MIYDGLADDEARRARLCDPGIRHSHARPET